MQSRQTWIGIVVGSTVGGLIPQLWGAGFLDLSSLVFSALGAVAGIYVMYRLTH